jgi:hypothetical protein
VRLKGLGNFSLSDEGTLVPTEEETQKTIHFVPKEGALKARVLMPDGEWVEGLAEKATEKLKTGDLVQLERFGFCRKDVGTDYWFSHK